MRSRAPTHGVAPTRAARRSAAALALTLAATARLAAGQASAPPSRPPSAPPGAPTSATSDTPGGQRVARVARVALEHALPALDGATLRSTIVEVTYPPGATSTPHSHPCPVLGYVARGAVRMQFDDAPERVYQAGETFYEAPNGRHLVSANASATAPAVLVATFVCDGKAGALSVPVKP
jgi:quercetin dioxygenase-like cupin family protein